MTWMEAVRQRFFAGLVLLSIGVVLSSVTFRAFNFGSSELKFLADFGFGGLSLFGSILAIVGSAQVLFSELESRSVLTILAKPVRRGEFILGKFVGIAAVIVAYVGTLTLVLAAVLWLRERALIGMHSSAGGSAEAIQFGGVWMFAALQAVKFLLLAAMTMLIGSYARTNLFTIICGFVVLVICHLQPVAQDVWSRSTSPLVRLAGGAIAVIFPNFQLLSLGDGLNPLQGVAWIQATVVAGYGLGYTLVVLALAMFSFGRRDI